MEQVSLLAVPERNGGVSVIDGGETSSASGRGVACDIAPQTTVS